MHISDRVFQTAANSQLGRLELRDTNGDQTCICNKSFSGWVVHVIRYKFSKNYRAREQETRRQILIAALGKENNASTLTNEQQDVLLDRKSFNRYINTKSKEVANIEPTGRKEPNDIPPDTSVQTSQTDETPAQVTNVAPTPRQESNVVVPDTSVQPPQTDETPAQVTNVAPTPRQDPGTVSAKESSGGEVKTGNEAGGKLQPPSERKLSQSRTKQADSIEKAKPNESLPKETASKPERANHKPAIGKTAASAQPIRADVLTAPSGDTKSNSDNQTWIGKRDRWATYSLEEEHIAAVFYVRDNEGSIAHNFRISEAPGQCVSTVATLEKRIGERLEQCDSNASANTKHFLTYLTLRGEELPADRNMLFEDEDMRKSSPTATWDNDFMKGGILGIPPVATKCGRRLPTGVLMFCANKVISELPIDKETGIFRGNKKSAAGHILGEMNRKAADPEYRKEFIPDDQELTQESFEWLLNSVASFGSYCNQEGY